MQLDHVLFTRQRGESPFKIGNKQTGDTMRTLQTVNQEYTNTLTLAGEKQYLIKRLTLELSALNAKADQLNIEAGELKKKELAGKAISDDQKVLLDLPEMTSEQAAAPDSPPQTETIQ